MARLHYYEFPEGVPADIREANGADGLSYTCTADPQRYADPDNHNPSKDCPHRDGVRGCINCSKLKCTEAGHEVGGISITGAKELLAKFGGHAYTRHIDRDGSCFEVTPILPKKNNSRHKYNVHL